MSDRAIGPDLSYYLFLAGLMKVLLWLLHPDPHSRATLADLMNDKWTNQIVDITKYSFEAVIRGKWSPLG